MADLPTGTVTFLFTDIEGSTRLAQNLGAGWSDAKAHHHALLRNAIESHGGQVFQIIGDAFCAAFHTAPDALAAAIEAQRALAGAALVSAPDGQAAGMPLRVRMGIHTGAAIARPDGDYDGYLTLVRVQRIMSGAYGGQVLMSQDVADLVGRDLPAGVTLRDLGMHRLKDLSALEHLQQLVAPDLPIDFPPLKTADHPNNLPAQLTSFIGRETEVAEVRRLLGGSRLLTLLGAGGIGKTRLALRVASHELATFSDGVWFVALATLTDPALIASAITAAVGVREEPNRPMLATLGDYFQGKSALIVLDNCEHLIAEAAQVCDSLLHAAPNLKIVATSREAMGIAGEHAFRVPALGVPPDLPEPKGLASRSGLAAQYESVSLFVERAQAARSDFALTSASEATVSRICRRLDGIPLAIELAAARMRGMTVEQIAARLDDRFRILTGGSRTALPRQQTLRATVDWSFRLLSEQEKMLLRRLSVFAGGWTLEAAERVCADPAESKQMGESPAPTSLPAVDVLDHLSRLVDRSLIILDESDDEPRYRMLETIRQYLQEELDQSGETIEIRDRHARMLADFAERTERASQVSGQIAVLNRVRLELENIRAALVWAETDNVETGLRLAGRTSWAWEFLATTREGYDWLVKFLERSREQRTVSRAHALTWAGYFANAWFGAPVQSRAYTDEAIAILRAFGNESELALALVASSSALRESDPEQTFANLTEAVTLSLANGDIGNAARANNSLGELMRFQRDFSRAEKFYEQSIQLNRQSGRMLASAVVMTNLAQVALQRNDPGRAQSLAREVLTISMSSKSIVLALYALIPLAGAAAQRRETLVAARLCGGTAGMLSRLNFDMQPIDRADFDQHLTLARSQSDPVAFEAAYAEGYAMSPDEAIAYALEASRN